MKRPTLKETSQIITKFLESIVSCQLFMAKSQITAGRDAMVILQNIGHDIKEADKAHPDDFDHIASALNMRANYIETGDPLLSAADFIERKKKPRELREESLRLVDRLRELADGYRS